MIFADSSFLIAYFNENDQWHKQSLKVAMLIKNREKVISNLIISETVTNIGSLLRGKAGNITYNHLIKNYHVIYDNKIRSNNAMKIYLKYDGGLSLADSLSIQIMNEQNITEIASFDSDFDKVKKSKGFFNLRRSSIF
ncbi:PIN domain protein [Methanobrevibacter cuticularis]|uniref:PIN domain protein n=1 Tax=Methanobrevibacter cuticularis TaxID=47311 RepID=A0A166CHL4_9EURY|nr:PIN domain-containing protein [Methanobrevibacter cuticularis]KZX14518.1 PIN domain protein [Methanobrevibacter cuticularis]